MESSRIKIYDEISFLKIKSRLIEDAYDFKVILYSDTALPIFESSSPYAEIIVKGFIPEGYLDDLGELRKSSLKKINKPPKQLIEKPKKKFKWHYLLIAYSLISTVLLLKYWYLNSFAIGDKHHTYEWSLDGTTMSVISRETGEIKAKQYDQNYDLNFEKLLFSDAEYNYFEKQIDEDEDGNYEEAIQTVNGNQTVIWKDQDLDGYFDHAIFFLDNGDTLFLNDTNWNFHFEARIHPKRE